MFKTIPAYVIFRFCFTVWLKNFISPKFHVKSSNQVYLQKLLQTYAVLLFPTNVRTSYYTVETFTVEILKPKVLRLKGVSATVFLKFLSFPDILKSTLESQIVSFTTSHCSDFHSILHVCICIAHMIETDQDVEVSLLLHLSLQNVIRVKCKLFATRWPPRTTFIIVSLYWLKELYM